jgi:hypothetical protein
MHTAMTQTQKSAYGSSQAFAVQTNRLSANPMPLTTISQPNHGRKIPVARTAQPQNAAKVPRPVARARGGPRICLRHGPQCGGATSPMSAKMLWLVDSAVVVAGSQRR